MNSVPRYRRILVYPVILGVLYVCGLGFNSGKGCILKFTLSMKQWRRGLKKNEWGTEEWLDNGRKCGYINIPYIVKMAVVMLII